MFPNARDGESANDLLGMILAGGIVESEEIFYARGGSRFRKMPDNVFDTPENLLEPGECGFGYVMLRGGVPMSTLHAEGSCAARPVLVVPLRPGSGGADPEFNKKPYGGRAVYLRLDQSVKLTWINDADKVVIPGSNRTLFETGPATAWGAEVPEVHPPE